MPYIFVILATENTKFLVWRQQKKLLHWNCLKRPKFFPGYKHTTHFLLMSKDH